MHTAVRWARSPPVSLGRTRSPLLRGLPVAALSVRTWSSRAAAHARCCHVAPSRCRTPVPARLPPRLAAHTTAPHSAAGCLSQGRSFCRRAWPRTSGIGRGADIVASPLPSHAAAYARCRYVAPSRCHTSLPARWPSRVAAHTPAPHSAARCRWLGRSFARLASLRTRRMAR